MISKVELTWNIQTKNENKSAFILSCRYCIVPSIYISRCRLLCNFRWLSCCYRFKARYFVELILNNFKIKCEKYPKHSSTKIQPLIIYQRLKNNSSISGISFARRWGLSGNYNELNLIVSFLVLCYLLFY